VHSNRTHLLLILAAVLLTLNLAATIGSWLFNPPAAHANIVEGKNWFSTSSDDGRVVYLWQYITPGDVGAGARGQIKYYGRITAGGGWQGE
jgi:hypothetical protein